VLRHTLLDTIFKVYGKDDEAVAAFGQAVGSLRAIYAACSFLLEISAWGCSERSRREGAPYGSRSLYNSSAGDSLLIDLTNCSAEEIIEPVTEVERILTAQPRNSVFTLSDLTGAQLSCAAVTRNEGSCRI
jgi:hypothetical protein